MDGQAPVAVALIASAVVRLSAKALEGRVAYAPVAATFVGSFVLRVLFLLLLAAGGLAGIAPAGARRGARPRRSFPVALALVALAFAAGVAARPELRAGASGPAG